MRGISRRRVQEATARDVSGHEHLPRAFQGRRQLASSTAISLGGSILPAFIGVAGTIVATGTSHAHGLVVLLSCWSVVGYMALTDFGLTRSASTLVASRKYDVDSIIASLWRVAFVVGGSVAVVVGAGVLLISKESLGTTFALMALATVPLSAALQFPVIGALEARGRFPVLAVQRTMNATFTYLVPAVLVCVRADGYAWGVIAIAVYRACSLVTLSLRLGVSRHTVATALPTRRAERVEVGNVVAWVGISSIVGPLLLYVDRAFLSLMHPPQHLWITYLSTSELLMKSYVIPSAVLSVAYPWLITNLRSQVRRVRSVVLGVLPAVTVAAAGLAFAVCVAFMPSAIYVHFSLGPDLRGDAAIAMGALVAGTLLNWLSQVFIAVLHAGGQQRPVATIQLWLALPYVCLLGLATVQHSTATVAIAWALRIAVVAALLFVLAKRSLASLARESHGPLHAEQRPARDLL